MRPFTCPLLVAALLALGGACRTAPVPFDPETARLRRLAANGESAFADALDQSMILVPAGEFIMGSDDGDGRDDERPQHRVYLDAYEIGRYEVTNAQYRRFLLATGRAPPQYWTGSDDPPGRMDHPVVGVAWEDASEYCAWAGQRLPSEAEWEKACRGPYGWIYPWGNAWDARRANVDVSNRIAPAGHTETEDSVWDRAWQWLSGPETVAPEHPSLKPVGSYLAGASPYGVLDLAGNASEWVADWYNWGDYTRMPPRNPLGLSPPWNRCLRGSPWHDPVGDAGWARALSRCAARNSSHAGPDPRVGFRCARSLSAAAP